MSNDVAHKSWWQIFEVVFGIPFLIALLMQKILPMSFPRGTIGAILVLGGVLLLFAGITLVVRARREFARYGQPTDPGHPTREMITTGVFSISRKSPLPGRHLFPGRNFSGVQPALGFPPAPVVCCCLPLHPRRTGGKVSRRCVW